MSSATWENVALFAGASFLCQVVAGGFCSAAQPEFYRPASPEYKLTLIRQAPK